MDLEEEFVASATAKGDLKKQSRRMSVGARRDSPGDAYVRKVADWLEAGGPRGSLEAVISAQPDAGDQTSSKLGSESSSGDAYETTMYFDSIQTWDPVENVMKTTYTAGSGRGRRKVEANCGRVAEMDHDTTRHDTCDLRIQDLTTTAESHSKTDSYVIEDGSSSASRSPTDRALPLNPGIDDFIVDKSSLRSDRRSSIVHSSGGLLRNLRDGTPESDSECLTEDLSRIMTKLCVRVADDSEALQKNPGEIVVALNAGSSSPVYSTSGVEYLKDQFFQGGDVLRTDDHISEASEQALYQTARYGNIAYKFTDLPCGDYFVDLHFAEIVFTNGPSGMRVFDVAIQGEKVISDLDVYGEVGSNKPLILCTKTCVVNGSLIIVFEGVIGNPTISAICIRRAPFSGSVKPNMVDSKAQRGVNHGGPGLSDPFSEERDSLPPLLVEHKSRRQQLKSKARKCVLEYEAKVEELKNECHEAWISLQDSNRRVEGLQIDLVSKSVTIDALANVVESQESEMKELRDKAEGGMQRWKAAFANLLREVEVVKVNYAVLANETKEWISTFPDTSGMISAVQSLVNEHDDLRKKYAEESLERRQLYNKVLELKGNIRVFCRCRPLSAFEVSQGAGAVVEFDAVKDNELIVRTGNSKKLFKFDRVFTPQDDQGEVFGNTAPVVVSVLDGYNVCIFAYGQTGTGKTFTMEGTPDHRGVNYRTLEELFHVAEQRKAQFNYEICVSVLEVYNEQIRDLLAPPPEPDQPVKKLEIRQVPEGGHHVPGLVEAPVHCMEQVWDVLQVGSSARAVESTNSNEHSSRSHCMLCVMVKGHNLITGECTRSKLWLVDLAGSERVAKSDVQGDRLREAQSINKSLSALGDVIAALTTKSSHVPYRNSKLTHLLQDSLGGDSKTLMFVQISPNEEDVGESLCSLNFASRVRGVELGPARKQLDSSELFKYKQLAERAKQEGRTKEEAMKKMEDNLRSTEVKLKVKEHLYQALLDKVKEKEKSISDLEAQLAIEKKARLAATASLKEKTSHQPINPANKDLKTLSERRPLLEKVHEHTDGLATHSSPRAGRIASPVEKLQPQNENADPQQVEACEDVAPVKAARTKVVPSRYNSPTLGRKVVRRPMRASIASTYSINLSTLTSSFSSESESGVDGSKENSRSGNDTRDLPASALHRPGGPSNNASGAAGRRAVHFASPVFQKEKAAEQRPRDGHPEYLSTSTHNAGQLSERSLSLGGVADAKKLGVGKLRRVSIARTFGRFPATTLSGGAQRVLSTASTGAKSLTAIAPQPQKERRWNK